MIIDALLVLASLFLVLFLTLEALDGVAQIAGLTILAWLCLLFTVLWFVRQATKDED